MCLIGKGGGSTVYTVRTALRCEMWGHRADIEIYGTVQTSEPVGECTSPWTATCERKLLRGWGIWGREAEKEEPRGVAQRTQYIQCTSTLYTVYTVYEYRCTDTCNTGYNGVQRGTKVCKGVYVFILYLLVHHVHTNIYNTGKLKLKLTWRSILP